MIINLKIDFKLGIKIHEMDLDLRNLEEVLEIKIQVIILNHDFRALKINLATVTLIQVLLDSDSQVQVT